MGGYKKDLTTTCFSGRWHLGCLLAGLVALKWLCRQCTICQIWSWTCNSLSISHAPSWFSTPILGQPFANGSEDLLCCQDQTQGSPWPQALSFRHMWMLALGSLMRAWMCTLLTSLVGSGGLPRPWPQGTGRGEVSPLRPDWTQPCRRRFMERRTSVMPSSSQVSLKELVQLSNYMLHTRQWHRPQTRLLCFVLMTQMRSSFMLTLTVNSLKSEVHQLQVENQNLTQCFGFWADRTSTPSNDAARRALGFSPDHQTQHPSWTYYSPECRGPECHRL